MQNYPKQIKRLIREWSTEAYERELNRELQKLDRSFSEWRDGTIGSGELSHRVHQYNTGPSKELFKKDNHGDSDMNIAYAIAAGILDEEEVPDELLKALQRPLAFYLSLKSQGNLKVPN